MNQKALDQSTARPRPARRSGLRRELRRKWTLYLFLVPAFAMLLLFMYYPAFTALRMAFYQWDGFNAPRWIGLQNFGWIIANDVMRASFVNMLLLTLARLLIILSVPLLAAELVFNLKSERWQYWYRVLFVVPLVVPALVSVLIWRFIFNPSVGLANVLLENIGLAALKNNWLGDHRTVLLSLALIGFPWVAGLNFLIYLAGLQNISRDVLDAARVDGATRVRRFWMIDLPLISSQMKLLVILGMIDSLQSFVPVLVITNGGPGYASMVPGLLMYQEAFTNGRFGRATAIGMVLFIAIFALTYVNLRYIRAENEHTAQ